MRAMNAAFVSEKTGGLDLYFGNQDAALELLHQMADGVGFGTVANKGICYMKKYFEDNYGADPKFLLDIGMKNKGLEYSEYVTKDTPAQWSPKTCYRQSNIKGCFL